MANEAPRKRLILGVDPGLTGALAFFDPVMHEPKQIFDMPLHDIRGKNHLDLYALARIVETYAAETCFAAIEEVGAAPKQGVSSTFRFGFTAGSIAGIISTLRIPSQFVRPSVWKTGLGLPPGDKDASRARASQLFPDSASEWARVKDHGRAEALLLAVYAKRFLSLFSSGPPA